MKQSHWLAILRWISVLPVVGLSLIATVFLAVRIDPLIYNELLRRGIVSIGSFGDYPITLVWDGPLAAIVFVLAGAWVAPGYRRAVALALFGLGVLLTPGLVEQASMSLYGVSAAVGKIDVACKFWTIASTYIGGALAVAYVFVATRRSSSRLS